MTRSILGGCSVGSSLSDIWICASARLRKWCACSAVSCLAMQQADDEVAGELAPGISPAPLTFTQEPAMQYRRLGRSGLKVSPLCLGTMMFGGETDEQAAQKIVRHAFEAGINFIDIADAYNEGRSEEVTARASAGERERWVVATKLGNQVDQGQNGGGLSRKWVMTAVEGSLRRLATDYIDIYYLHKEDHGTPLEETVHALVDLVRAGKIRYFGVSNYRAWRVAELH